MRSFVATLLLALVSGCGMLTPVAAEWKPEYAQASPEVREWYRQAELTEEARKRFRWVKCCDHADVFRTQFKVNKTTGGDEWWYLTKEGQWKLIPPDIIHTDQHAPDNQPTLFIYAGKETCFFPGGSGI